MVKSKRGKIGKVVKCPEYKGATKVVSAPRGVTCDKCGDDMKEWSQVT
jgi:hypothetical protein